jgi:undecaprenyl phosphate N,N'-diacetylbacillosamine 1-phosphate transferase
MLIGAGEAELLMGAEYCGVLFGPSPNSLAKIGKFMRKWSIDELPQILNVLRGDMSFIGPRPHLPEEVARYTDRQKQVLTIKPGITGMAQVY